VDDRAGNPVQAAGVAQQLPNRLKLAVNGSAALRNPNV
jgi:hypothetical protein